MTEMPASLSQLTDSVDVASATSVTKTAPSEAWMPAGEYTSVRGLATMTASAAAALAVRTNAPRFPGFSKHRNSRYAGKGSFSQ